MVVEILVGGVAAAYRALASKAGMEAESPA